MPLKSDRPAAPSSRPSAKPRGRPRGAFTTHRRLDALRALLARHPKGMSLYDLADELRVTPRSLRRYLQEVKRELDLESVAAKPGGRRLWRLAPGEAPRKVEVRRTQAYALLAARRLFEPMRGLDALRRDRHGGRQAARRRASLRPRPQCGRRRRTSRRALPLSPLRREEGRNSRATPTRSTISSNRSPTSGRSRASIGARKTVAEESASRSIRTPDGPLQGLDSLRRPPT